MRPWVYNMLAIAVGTVFVLACAAVLLALMFVGSAHRMANITQLGVFSLENLKATVPLFLVSALIVIGMLLFYAWRDGRNRG